MTHDRLPCLRNTPGARVPGPRAPRYFGPQETVNGLPCLESMRNLVESVDVAWVPAPEETLGEG